ncbi:Cell wall / vacuolar inhibitor of fructosidase 1 [Linum perenne]
MATCTELATPLSAFFILLLLSLTTAEGTPLIKETCKQTPDYALCVTLLSSRAAKATTVKSLALAMIDVVKAKATATSLQIKKLIKTTSSPQLKAALQTCDSNYGVIIDFDVPGAVTEVKYGNPKFGVDSMVDSAAESQNCEDQFRGKGKSPLTSRNEDVRRVSDVAAAVSVADCGNIRISDWSSDKAETLIKPPPPHHQPQRPHYKTTMTPKLTTLTSAVAVFLILITTTTAHATSAAASTLIKQTCKQTPDYNLCVSSLTADPRALKADDVDTLALIMIDVVKDKATAASKEKKRLLKSKTALKEPLKDCDDMYKVIIEDDVSVAIKALSLGDPKFGQEAMNDASNESDSCERGFKWSPLTDFNKVVRKVADVASAIIRLLL